MKTSIINGSEVSRFSVAIQGSGVTDGIGFTLTIEQNFREEKILAGDLDYGLMSVIHPGGSRYSV